MVSTQSEPTKQQITKLRIYRAKIISSIEEFNLEIPKDFKVSSAGQVGKKFKIEITFSNPQNNYAAIATNINEGLNILKDGAVTATARFIIVDLEKKTKRETSQISLSEPKTAPVVTTESKTRKETHTFLKEMREVLKEIIPEKELEKQTVLKKYSGLNNGAEIYIPDPLLLNKTLFFLEEKGYPVASLGEVVITGAKGSTFIPEIPWYKKISSEVALCKKWLQSVLQWIHELQLEAVIHQHPIVIVQNNYDDEISFKCKESGKAPLLARGFELNKIPTRKNVHVVYAQISREIIAAPFLQVAIELKKRGLLAKSESEHGEVKYVHMNTDYSLFHLLPFNRDIDMDHAESIARSMDEFGVIDFVKVVETDCVDGILKKWIIDGQHTFTAMQKRGLPVRYVLIHVDLLSELVRLTAVLNNRRRPWKSKDYLKAWISLNVPVYQTINTWIEKKLGFSLILEALSGRDPKAAMLRFKDGNFQAENSAEGPKLLSYIMELKPILPRSMKIHTGVLRFIRSCGNTYQHERLKELLEKKKQGGSVFFAADDTIPQIIDKVRLLYNSGI